MNSPGHFRANLTHVLRTLSRDWVVQLSLVLYLEALLALARAPSAATGPWDTLRALIDPFLLGLTITALLWGRSLLVARERGFWDLLALAWGCWLLVDLIYFFDLDPPFVSANFLADSLYFLYYFLLALAVDRQAHQGPNRPPTTLDRRLESAAGLAAIFGVLCYFAVVVLPDPLGVSLSFGRTGGYTPFLLVRLSLDALLLGRLVFSTFNVVGRWRILYGLLSLGLLGYTVRDALALLRYEALVPTASGFAAQAMLYLPGFIVLLAARSRHAPIVEPVETRPSDAATLLPAPVRPSIALYSLVVPALHFLLYPLGQLDEASHNAREVFSLAYVLVLGTMAWIHQRVLTTDTARAHSALLEAEEKLAQSRKLESVGRLAGGIAHDFNNYLTVIQGYGEILRDRLRGTPEAADLAYIEDASKKATHLTRQLLAFGRRQVLRPEALELNQVVRDTAKMLDSLLGEDVTLKVDLASDTGLALADLGQTEQVLVNLAINGRDAMPEGGTLTISSRRTRIGSAEAADLEIGPGDYLALEVSDTGVGMSEEVRSQVFEPFFTTKEVGRGTGLGLSTVYGIVTQSEGAITVESAPRQGTTVRVVLPAATPAVEELLTEPLPAFVPSQATLLLVEDEAAVRKLAASALTSAGLQVHSAANGQEAMTRYLDGCDSIDLLVTDVLMPGMDGVELASRFQTRNPSLKVLFISGYPADTLRERQKVLPQSIRLLQKPFSPSKLVETVHEALEETSPLTAALDGLHEDAG